jgi:hypothetical protein
MTQVKPEMGISAMRGKQAARRRGYRSDFAAQQIQAAMQHKSIPHCTNHLEL